MDYKRLWNELKRELVSRAEYEHKPGVEAEEYLMYASKLLMKMNRAEVAECRKEYLVEKDIDLGLAETLFGKECVKNG